MKLKPGTLLPNEVTDITVVVNMSVFLIDELHTIQNTKRKMSPVMELFSTCNELQWISPISDSQQFEKAVCRLINKSMPITGLPSMDLPDHCFLATGSSAF
jgi:hypothetical protein